MKGNISTAVTPSNITKIVNLLATTPQQLEALSQRFSDEQLCQSSKPGERSATEILAHLLHCEARSSEAIYLALLVNEPVFIDIHPERQLGKLLHYDLLAFSELLAYFKFRRTVLLRVLTPLTAEKWLRCIQEEGKKRKESVYWRARSLALHELEHLSELTNNPQP